MTGNKQPVPTADAPAANRRQGVVRRWLAPIILPPLVVASVLAAIFFLLNARDCRTGAFHVTNLRAQPVILTITATGDVKDIRTGERHPVTIPIWLGTLEQNEKHTAGFDTQGLHGADIEFSARNKAGAAIGTERISAFSTFGYRRDLTIQDTGIVFPTLPAGFGTHSSGLAVLGDLLSCTRVFGDHVRPQDRLATNSKNEGT
ncbi:MAG: hypothetical protein HOK61_02445 [Alphaproteobacteria bacterium]|nr:hypothetical protein [Alphaproteobacteria bacterium]